MKHPDNPYKEQLSPEDAALALRKTVQFARVNHLSVTIVGSSYIGDGHIEIVANAQTIKSLHNLPRLPALMWRYLNRESNE